MQMPQMPDGELELAALQERLVQARHAGQHRETAEALIALCRATHARGLVAATVRYADEAWEIAQREHYWDLLSQLALFFGDLCCEAENYAPSYDHYANACAYALAADPDYFWDVVEHVDDVLTELVRIGRTMQALALCEMLIGYEEYGGLGERVPAFAAHYGARRDWLERLHVQSRLTTLAAMN